MNVNILFISTERRWQGGEEQLRLLAEGVHQRGHTVQIVVRKSAPAHRRLAQEGLDVIPLAGNVRGPRAIWQLRRALRQTEFDILFANDPHALALMNWATWGRCGVVQVATRRVLFPIRSAGKYRRCQAVVAISHAIGQVCRASGIPDERIHVVHDGVDPARVRAGDAIRGRQSLQLAPEVPLVLCVASLVECKGHRHLLDAVPTILRAHPQFVLALAGEGPLLGELDLQIDKLGIRDQVRLLGYRHDVPDLINACDLLVLPSLEEGLGSSVLDAMFCEKPVVATTAGGLPEMLLDHGSRPCGWLVPPSDSAALATAINEALANRAESQVRARRGHEWASEEFTADRMVDRTLALFELLLMRQRSAP